MLAIDNGIATITLGEDDAITTLSRAVAGQLENALDAIERDASLRCVVLTGRGRSFAVGANIKELHDLEVADAIAYNTRLIEIGHRVEALPVPVVAGVNGLAFGGGLELALACTTRIAADEALMGLPEVKVGILPGSGGLPRLPRTIGRGMALRMLVTGMTVDAQEALRIGLVDSVVPTAQVHDAAQELAESIAANAPLAVRAVLSSLRAIEGLEVREAVCVGNEGLLELLSSRDAKEGMGAFIERRLPVFEGA